MKVKQIISVCIAGVAVIGLTACNSMHSKSDNKAEHFQSAEVESYGIGEEGQLAANNSNQPDPAFANKCPADVCFYFDYDDNTVQEYDYATIITQARYLAGHPNVTLRIEGNTDERGSREYNLALGERRADSIAELLKVKGGDGKQMLVTSNGKEKPITLSHNESAYRFNRRVDLYFCTADQADCG